MATGIIRINIRANGELKKPLKNLISPLSGLSSMVVGLTNSQFPPLEYTDNEKYYLQC